MPAVSSCTIVFNSFHPDLTPPFGPHRIQQSFRVSVVVLGPDVCQIEALFSSASPALPVNRTIPGSTRGCAGAVAQW